MPSDEQRHGSTTVSNPETGRPEPGGLSQSPVTPEGDGHDQSPPFPWGEGPTRWYPGPEGPPLWYRSGQGPRPAPPARRRSHVSIVIVATLLVFYLVAVGVGVGIGYAAFSSTAPVASPTSTTPTTTPTTSPKAAAIATRVDPGLVDIDTVLSYQTVVGAGTGMVVTSSGEVFTNNHVIDDETSLHVTDVGNGKTYAAAVVGYDVTADIAVLQIQGASHLRTVSFASVPAKVGDAVVAIGNAGGRGGTPSAVSGTITGVDQAITAENELSGATEHLRGMIQTDAPTQEGDSGGPIVNATGKVLGMDTAASANFIFAHKTAEGFAIPIGTVRNVAAGIVRGVSSSTVHIGATAFLGVEVANVDTTGAVVEKVLPSTVATAIGLAAGDTIVSLGGHAIRNSSTLSDVLQVEKPGATVPISWQDQSGKSHATTVTLRSGPPA